MASSTPSSSSRQRTGLSSGPSMQNASDSDDTPTNNSMYDLSESQNQSAEEALKARQALPFWKRPTPWWLIVLYPFSSIVMTLVLGAEVELYTELACKAIRRAPPPNDLAVTFPPSTNATYQVPKGNSCSSDPAVQALTAELITAITITTGTLTFFTVGWWGSFSDRHGRKKTIGFSAIGHAISALNIILVAKYAEYIPGGYWLLIVNAGLVGLLGSIQGENAAVFAYLSDITTSEERSSFFSIVYGMYIAGIGVGPVLGSIIVRTTHNVLAVFYVALALRLIYAFAVWFILPESLTPAQMQRAAVKHQDKSDRPTMLWLRVKQMFFFLKPLSILLPERIRGGKRDWNLAMLVMAYGLMLLAASSLMNQFLYASLTFQWDSEYLGYCLTAIGITRAVFLTLMLPFIIKVAKNWRRKSVAEPESTPLLADPEADATPKAAPELTAAFDLGIARLSILWDGITFGVLPFAPTGIIFILFTSLGSLGAGLGPAINSVALELYSRRRRRKNAPVESGKLFGALSVVQAVFAATLGPLMYGSIYATTVAKYPKTIFFVALGNAILALLALSFVRVPPPGQVDDSDDEEEVA